MDKKTKTKGQFWNAILAVLIGIPLIAWPADAVRWAVIVVGILALARGANHLFYYFALRGTQGKGTFDLFFGALLALWGVSLLLQTDVWISLFMVVMSIPMILLAIGQVTLLNHRKEQGFTVRRVYYVLPILFMAAGVAVMLHPFKSTELLVTCAGIWSIAYGAVEMAHYLLIRK